MFPSSVVCAIAFDEYLLISHIFAVEEKKSVRTNIAFITAAIKGNRSI